MHHNIINSKWNDRYHSKRHSKLSRKLYTAQDAPLKTEEKISDTYVPEPFVPPLQYQVSDCVDSYILSVMIMMLVFIQAAGNNHDVGIQ